MSKLRMFLGDSTTGRRTFVVASAALVLAALSCVPVLLAQDSSGAPSATVQVLITARAKRGAAPALTAQDVSVHEDKKPRPVVSLVPFSRAGSPLQLVILIDSDSSPRLGAQFHDISQFLQALPQNAEVALAYAANGSARIQQQFTTDRAAITKGLHLTVGPSAGNTSIYEAVSELVRKWPGGPEGRELLLISNGIDRSYGLFGTQPNENPALQAAIRDAQKNRVTVFSIFVRSGRMSGVSILALNGEGSLNELTSSTGGNSYALGTQTPISFTPFLDDIQRLLGQQYMLTFDPARSSRAGFHDFKAATEISGVKLLAPAKVYISAAK